MTVTLCVKLSIGPNDGVNARIPWSDHRHARARARHLASVPQGGARESLRSAFAGIGSGAR